MQRYKTWKGGFVLLEDNEGRIVRYIDHAAEVERLTAERDAATARAERAESCLRSLDPYFEFSSLPNGAEGFVVAGDAAGLTEVFAEAASILFGDHIADALAQAEKVKS